ncbi:MAG: helix-turn-helix domain-containing protein [Desulfovibrionaceae bacterium]|nr:helix-turn-helix domain-containing protein [Desulfovibrionaceae bacterium]MBF0513671.1 helix-turn-helix domain-containing protein [Desulfovibrionaceae bacterium]
MAIESSVESSGLQLSTEEFEQIWARLKLATSSVSDVDLAEALEVKQGTISVTKKRAQIPPVWVTKISKKYKISADWILYGQGQMGMCYRVEGDAADQRAQALERASHFAGYLKALRQERRLSHRDLATRIGVDANTIQAFELGQIPTESQLLSLARALGCSVDLLVGVQKEAAHKSIVGEETREFLPADDDVKISDLLTKTAKVLESDTIYRTALTSNINAFHQAVLSEKTLAIMEKRMSDVEKRLEGLEKENAALRCAGEASNPSSKAVGGNG